MKLVELVEHYLPPFMGSFVEQNKHIIDVMSNFLDCEQDEAARGVKARITPRMELIFSTFHLVSMDPYGLLPNSLRVVFMFQDTYPTPGCACGVATATPDRSPQPTLSNIFKRLHETYKPTEMAIVEEQTDDGPKKVERLVRKEIAPLHTGDIRGWCTQGVLMYNAALTTREREIGAHLDTWQCFTARMIEWLSETYPFLVFVMFGKEAQGYGKYINSNKHAILKTSHPAGRGYNHGFHDCDIFNEVNKILETNKREPIQWENYQYYTNTSPSS